MPYKRNQLRSMFFAAVIGFAVLMPGMINKSYAATEPFNLGWLELLREEAVQKGVKPGTVGRLLPNTLQPLESVERQSQSQPEKRATLEDYLSKRVTPHRIAKGRQMMNDNASLLGRMERQHHVPPQLIMSIWAMETSYGSNMGDVNVIRALVTVARSRPEYRREVIEALHMIDEGYTQIETMPGSWAGAFGQTQFIPSSFRRLAIDGDGDGRKDIWTNLADIFASTANHLKLSGWKEGEPWGKRVILPPGFNRDHLTDLKKERVERSKTLQEWAQLGVRLPGGGALPLDYNKPVTLIAPNYNPQTDREVQGPVYVVYDNFWTILDYNSSYKYSLAVNMLADAIGRPQVMRQPE
ncbi:MAG: lytic murein transglycosylase [Micavibrio sp.]|nr:lytic murein transglycosylase [Micavibrio sp.]